VLAAYDPDAIHAEHFVFDRRRGGEHTVPRGPEGLEQRAVGKLTDDPRMDVALVEPLVEAPAERRGADRQQHRRAGERAGKALADAAGEAGGGQEGDTALTEHVGERLEPQSRTRRIIAHDEVELVQGELGEKPLGLAVDERHADVVAGFEGRSEQPVHEHLGQRVGHAHGESQRLPAGPVVEGVLQLPAEGEDLVGIAVDHPAGVGEGERFAGAVEERRLERLLQGPDLRAHRGLGEVEPPAGLRDAALADGGPEVEEVVVVEPVHGPLREKGVY
jgi:hypothetical protein